jgi:hypothetical protein
MTISAADQARIDFAQKLLDSGAMKVVRHDSVEFLRCVVKHGLIKSTADEMEAYVLHGRLLIDSVLTEKAQEFRIGAVLPGYARLRAIEKMSPKELVALRERVTNVLPFRRDK